MNAEEAIAGPVLEARTDATSVFASKANELIILPALRAQMTQVGALVVTRKFMSGLGQFARHWPGPVTALMELRNSPTADMDHVEVPAGGDPALLELRPTVRAQFIERLRNAAVVLAYLTPPEAALVGICREVGVPLVFVSEYSLRTELQMIDAACGNLLLRWRRKLWIRMSQRIQLAAVHEAAGIQCSGVPTYDIYRQINQNAFLFFDNRVRETDIISEADLAAKLQSVMERRPLRLVFGGRLTAIKGVLELPKIARELRRLGVNFSLHIFGSGDLEQQLRTDISEYGLQHEVHLGGVLDFQSGWIPFLKEKADVFVCCHPQGDPSSTYPEVMSCGVPIVGYDNEAFVGIVRRSGCGWMSPMLDPVAMAEQIMRLDRDRADIHESAYRARAFAAAHSFETTFAARIAHIKSLSRLPERLRTSVSC